MPPVLRDYQRQSLIDLAAAIREGHRRVVLVAPTGSGKTTVAGEMARQVVAHGGRVLFLVHRRELASQAFDRVTGEDGFGIPTGMILSGDKRLDLSLPMQVASVQTLARRPALDPAPTLIIVDEAHHSVSESWRKLLACYPSSIVVGITATPFTLAGIGLGSAGFTKLVVSVTPDALIEQGFLVPPRVIGPDAPDLTDVPKSHGDYVQDELGKAMLPGVKATVAAWTQHVRGGPLLPGPLTLAFAVTIEHSKKLVEAFVAAGIPAEHVDGETDNTTRRGIWERLRTGVTRVVSNVGVAGEGLDIPAVECVLLARPTMSLGLFLQMVGRGLRPFSGKTHAILLDCAGNVVDRLGRTIHGWPTRDLSGQYSLEGSVTPKGTRTPGCRRCPECFAVWPATQPWPCPACKFMPKVRQMRALDKHLQTRELKRDEVRDPPTESEQFGYFAYLYGECMVKRYKPTWISVRFKVRFGRWPPAEFWSKVKKSRRASG